MGGRPQRARSPPRRGGRRADDDAGDARHPRLGPGRPADAAHVARRARRRGLLAGLGLGVARPWAVLHPGATAPSRRYPPERFAAAAAQLAREDGWRFVVTGSEAESALADSVVAAAGGAAVSLAGRLSLAE